MYRLKEPVRIVLKKYGVVITEKSLEHDQSLADLVLKDKDLNKTYGHNFIEVAGKSKPDTIAVNLKKKADQVAEQQSQTSKATASTSKEVQDGGMILNVSDKKPESQSQGSQQSKPVTGNQSSQKRR